MSEFLRTTSARLAASGAGALLLLAGCSEPKTYENVSVTGWDITQDATVFTEAWVWHYGEDDLPDDDRAIRNIDDYSVKNGSTCVMYDEDFNCTMSVDNYETNYDYESFDTIVARSCLQEPIFSEFADSKISKDGACWDRRNPEEWLVKNDPEHIVRIQFQEDDETKQCIDTVPEEMYYRTSRERTGLTAKIDGTCWVIDLSYPEKEN